MLMNFFNEFEKPKILSQYLLYTMASRQIKMIWKSIYNYYKEYVVNKINYTHDSGSVMIVIIFKWIGLKNQSAAQIS